MTAIGVMCYRHGTPPSMGSGYLWNQDDLNNAINGPVSALVFDESGKTEGKELLAGVAETAFEQKQLDKILSGSSYIAPWQVGEAIAQAYLAQHRACIFPWPVSRDLRKEEASMPGADLIAIQQNEQGARFAFGEVKTSGENKYPPRVTYGPTGLKQQLENLRDQENIRNTLVKYLTFTISTTPWIDQFKVASKRYLNNTSDIQLFGVLVRDVTPNVKDVYSQVESLEYNCPPSTQIELLAIYLPTGAIKHLHTQVDAAKRRSGP